MPADDNTTSELIKLQQHLKLLKQQYANLSNNYTELERKYNILKASTTGEDDDSFAARLLKTACYLHQNQAYSDLRVKLKDGIVPGHRLIFNARLQDGSDADKSPSSLDGDELDWSHLDMEVAKCILHWIYTDQLPKFDNLVEIMRTAHLLKLRLLVSKCERQLSTQVNLRNCVLLYSVSEEVDASTLREMCSEFISTYWEDLSSADFEHMSGPLLYKMLKSKTEYPLQSAVRLVREDVLFLCLVEESDRHKLRDVVNSWSKNGELALDLALRAQNVSMARTLLQHEADVNVRNSQGGTLLHSAFAKNDIFAIKFLLENGADVNAIRRTDGCTVLHLLAEYGPDRKESVEEIATLLLTSRDELDVNRKNGAGMTALHLSIQSDNAALFDLLIVDERVDLNSPPQSPPLYHALIKYNSGTENYAEDLLKKTENLKTAYRMDEAGNCLLQRLMAERCGNAALFLVDHLDRDGLDYANDDGETNLHLSCKEQYPDLTRKLLEKGANANARTKNDEKTSLHYAKCAESVKMFTGRTGVNFNSKDAAGETPLSLALNQSPRANLELMSALIAGGADVNVRNSRDYTLLHQAIAKEDASLAVFLVESGADVNALNGSDLETPLHLAIACRLPQVVQALCTKGVNMGALDKNGACPLWSALESDLIDVAQILVKNGTDVDCWNEQRSLLHRAIDENNESAAQFLVQAGCDVDSSGPDGCTPLHMCCSWGLLDTVRCLIEHGANVNARDTENKTPIHHAILNSYSEIVSLLLCHPSIDLSLRDGKGMTPFAQALTLRNNEAAKWILDKYPAAAEQFDAKGMNFLHTAIKRDDLESVLFLLSVQVDVNSRVQDPTLTPPLHLAAAIGNETLVRSLLLAGARIDERDAYKQTALHVAAQNGNAPVCSALVQNRVDFDAGDINGDNALHVAVREGHLQSVRVLLTESEINAEALNLKGRNPMHELARSPKDNAAAICELFLECMPEYPVNKPDLDGNTPLLLAYMKGHGGLCRVLVSKGNASLAAENSERVTIFNYQVATKQLLYKLLDQLSHQSSWTQTPTQCQECGKGFSITVRKHHCRHCGRALCGRCSDEEVPIVKFGENKPVRVCKVCFDVLKIGSGMH